VIRPHEADVDHFIPWSRTPNNAVENLVVADRRANGDKSDHLAAAALVLRWRNRNAHWAGSLRNLAAANRWDTAPVETLGVARALYLGLAPSNLLWAGPRQFVPADVVALRKALVA
jgi:hypothetical protein